MTIEELDLHIRTGIQGMFGDADMRVMQQEIEKLEPGQVYVEIGVDEGRSFTVAHHYAKEGVFIVGIDIHDVPPHEVSVGRGPWAEEQRMIGIGKRGFFIHGDADEFAPLWDKPIDLLFIDGGHDYEEVKKNTLLWESKVAKGGTILFHDIDHPKTLQWVNEHYGKEGYVNCHDKIAKVVK